MTPPDHIEIARIDTLLLREFLPPVDERPHLNDCIWIEDVEGGPSPRGIRRLQAVQAYYGAVNITTAVSSRKGQIGVYVRGDVLRDTMNPLRAYLSHD